MAFAYISEYENMAQAANGYIVQAGQEPALAVQKLVNTGASAPSASFNARTRFVMVHTDSIMHIKFGSAAGADPTATNADTRMAAGETRFFGVVEGAKCAVILGT
jgi:hypothetical protein